MEKDNDQVDRFCCLCLVLATSAQAMPRAPLHQPDGMITQVRYYGYGYRHYGYRHYGYRHYGYGYGYRPYGYYGGIGTTAIGPTSMDPPAAMRAELPQALVLRRHRTDRTAAFTRLLTSPADFQRDHACQARNPCLSAATANGLMGA